jgi:hypothetical protein
MPEIGPSGSMSGDGKRRVAAWPKLPRPSSTLPDSGAKADVAGLPRMGWTGRALAPNDSQSA